jgi:hypothetical protein
MFYVIAFRINVRKNLPDDGPMDPKPVEGCMSVINLLLSNLLCVLTAK